MGADGAGKTTLLRTIIGLLLPDNGSHQNYSGNSIYQNGGNLGAAGIWYKGDFFSALTTNVGAGVADASTMYGSEDFPMLMTGVALSLGLRWAIGK